MKNNTTIGEQQEPGSKPVRALLRVFVVVLTLAFLVAVPFGIWGAQIEEILSIDGTITWMRETGWAWAVGIGLIASDVVLPVPSSAVMTALGVIYGPIVGGLISAVASVLAGSLGYWLCRALGPETAERLAGEEGLGLARRMFDRWGFLLIAASRWLPVLPETVSFMAGLIRVPYPRFLLALTCGSVPLGFVFASAGHLGRDAPLAVILGGAFAPVVLWALVRWIRGSASG
jgi:uncharacterized membrane protein YdjX (TVP38/TMEM64 family)